MLAQDGWHTYTYTYIVQHARREREGGRVHMYVRHARASPTPKRELLLFPISLNHTSHCSV